VLEVGESTRWPQFIVHQRLVLGCLDLVENRRQLIVVRHDLLRGLIGDMRIAGKYTATGSPTKCTFPIARIGWSWNAGP
jgi:hypothetical protein